MMRHFLFVGLFLLSTISSVSASILSVPGDYATISGALDDAVSGDVILIASGTYSPSTNGEVFPLLLKSGIDIQGVNPDLVIIDAEAGPGNEKRHIEALNVIEITISKITFRGGYIWGTSTWNGGVGVIDSSVVTFSQCRFLHNTGRNSGGALYFINSGGSVVDECFFEQNTAVTGGGAVFVTGQSITVQTCVFAENRAQREGGGAIRLTGNNNSLIEHNRFLGNQASGSTQSNFGGGAIHAYSNCNPVIRNNVFAENNDPGGNGGAIFLRYGGSAVIENNTFYKNTALTGAGIHIDRATPVIRNNIFSQHLGHTIYEATATTAPIPELYYNTFEGGTTGEYRDYETATVYSNPLDIDSLIPPGSNVGTLDSNPLFIDASAYVFQLQCSSPAIDSGDPDSIYNDPDGSRADQGAYGGSNSLYLADPVLKLTKSLPDNIDLLWYGPAPCTEYQLYRSSDPEIILDNPLGSTTTDHKYSDPELTSGDLWYYAVEPL